MGTLHPLKIKYRPVALLLLIASFVFGNVVLYTIGAVMLVASSQDLKPS